MQISVITINFNNKAGLVQTMESVLNQTYKDLEYIVIDGGSTDGSKEEIAKRQENLSFWVSEPDEGAYYAMNKGIERMSGKYALFLNSGDTFYNERVLEKFVEFNPVADLVYGDTLIVENTNKTVKKMPPKCTLGIALTHTLNHQSIFFKKSLFDEGQRYDTRFKIVADWVFVIEAILGNKTVKHIDLVVPCYDAHGMSSDKDLRVKERSDYLKSRFDAAFLLLLSDYNRLHHTHAKLSSKSWLHHLLLLERKLKGLF